MENYPRIVFMGSSDFSVCSLKKILEKKYCVVGVVTTPDTRAGRGRRICESSVKKYALEQNMILLQPQNLKEESFVKKLEILRPDIIIVVAFRILPKIIWKMPKLGTFNLHPSLLPNYRGSAPIQWAIINGEKETGVSTFLINEQIDSGALLLQKKTFIYPEDNAGSLAKRLAEIGSNLVVSTVKIMLKNTIYPRTQIHKKHLKIAPKFFYEDRKIHWQEPMETIYNKIRGFSPYPGAWTQLINALGRKFLFKIYYAICCVHLHSLPEATIIIQKNKMKIAVRSGYLSILEGQIEGGKRLQANDLINRLQGKYYHIEI